ncbi:histidine kinase [Streptomyces sp. NPDC052101]|uniref:sensor histidine kinase n=1 Tax=Streptomyces sp. NPDC052101 TaxID=3155763 RepID=UPI00343DC95C
MRKFLANAEQALADVCASLRAGRMEAEDSNELTVRPLGAVSSAGEVHPRKSQQAFAILFAVVLEAVVRLTPDSERTPGLLATVALSLERSTALWTREAGSGYTEYLPHQVRQAQIEERQRIARELHDRIGLSLSAMHRQLELYALNRETDLLKATLCFDAARQSVKDAMDSLRAVTSDLHERPPLQSLEKALHHYLDSIGPGEVTVRLRVNGDETWVPPDIADEVFLILREASHNALRHAEPTVLLIRVDIGLHDLRASVEDDGLGFDPQQAAGSGGVGIASMHERAGLLDGAVEVSSLLGAGTRVNLSIPLRVRDDD